MVTQPTTWEITVESFNAWKDKHTVTAHAILATPVGFFVGMITYYMDGPWYWQLTNATISTIIAFSFQEWGDQRAKWAIDKHHAEAPLRALDSGDATGRAQRKHDEVWHGWDWGDWIGGVLGGPIGAGLFIILFTL